MTALHRPVFLALMLTASGLMVKTAAEGEAFMLDTDNAPVAAPGMQYSPAVAFGEDMYLVVWKDSRLGQHMFGDEDVIYGARVTPNGVVLDTHGIAISRRPTACGFPNVSHSDSHFVVSWTEEPGSEDSVRHVVRVTREGIVLDLDGVTLSDTSPTRQPEFAQAGRYSMHVREELVPGASCAVFGIVTYPDDSGQVQRDVLISRAAYGQRLPAVAASREVFLVVWEDWRGDSGYSGIYGTRVTSDGKILDPGGFMISKARGWHLRPLAMFDGRRFLVAWEHWSSDPCTDACDAEPDGVRAAYVEPDGTVIEQSDLVPDSVLVNIQENRSRIMLSDADRLHAECRDDTVILTRETAAGLVVGSLCRLPTRNAVGPTQLVSVTGGVVVAWLTRREENHLARAILLLSVSDSGACGDVTAVSRFQGSHFSGFGIGAIGERVLVAYEDWTGTVNGKTYNNYRVWCVLSAVDESE